VRIAAALLLACVACVAACGASKKAKVAGFTLTSDAFADGQQIPIQCTCDGADQAPPLAWGEPPKGTRSFALVVDDPDAPGGTFRHWGAYDIPATARSVSGSFRQAVNDFGKVGYGGPCPPKGHGPHHYRFKLFALATDRLGLSNPKIAQVQAEAEKHVLGRAELTGTYERR
jgi:Raf kinase inhibitor-like YbhB/YbcL family protein